VNPTERLAVWWIIAALLALFWTLYRLDPLLPNGYARPEWLVGFMGLAGALVFTYVGRWVKAPLFLEKVAKERLLRSGAYGDPEQLALEATYHTLGCILIVAPWSLSTSLFDPLTLFALVAIPVPLAVFEVGFRDKIQSRKVGVEFELPFFSVFAAIIQRAGLSLYHALSRVALPGYSHVFTQMNREGELVTRDVKFLGNGVAETFERRAETHPSDRYANFLLSYTGVWRSGGDLAATLEDRVEELLEFMKFRWRGYAESVGTIGDMLAAVFITMPLLFLGASAAFPLLSREFIAFLALLAIPVIAIVAYLMVDSAMPRLKDTYTTHPEMLVAALATAAVGFYFGWRVEVWLGLAGGLLGFALVVFVSMYGQYREVSDGEKVIQQFVRDLAEYRKIGLSISEAIRRCAFQNRYNKRFNNFLKLVSGRLQMGHGVYDSAKTHRSWLVRTTFFVLSEINESGGGSVQLIERVVGMLRAHKVARAEASSRLTLYQVLALATPAILIVSVAVILSLLDWVALSEASSSILRISPANIGEVASAIMVVVVEASCAIAFIVGKMVDRNNITPWRVGVCAVLLLALGSLMPTMRTAMRSVLM